MPEYFVALGTEYDGTQYHGWQRQSNNVVTVQEALEKAISEVANEPIELCVAGRTDAGVHATGQVVHFSHTHKRLSKAWVKGCTSLLPESICVRWAVSVSKDFHARFSAVHRRYRYYILDGGMQSVASRSKITIYPHKLDAEAMHVAAQCLIGAHDFTTFRASDCQSNTANRYVYDLYVKREKSIVIIEICANAFLKHMVRNIVGALIHVGAKKKSITWMKDILEKRDRTEAAETAPPHGLYLVDVQYPDIYEIPKGRNPILLV